MTYKIKFTKVAEKYIKKLDIVQRTRIYKAIFKLPDNGDIKRIKGKENLYRLRVRRLSYNI